MFSKFFIDRPIFATVIALIMVFAGILCVRTLPIAQYPDITPPTVMVSASYPGANASTVARTVGVPIEEQVNGVEGMLYMSSNSGSDGSYSLTITFENGVATACDVDASTETESLGQAAAPTVADAIVAGNTPNVDAVSGSTVTSNAIMEAAKACYDAAGIAY